MRYTLSYGLDESLQLELPDDAQVVDCSAPRGQPLGDAAAAMMSSLAHPVQYPPLAAATVPGDRVVLAVEPGMRQVETVVAGAVYGLTETGTLPRDITLVIASNVRAPLSLLPKSLRQELRVVLHNPSDQQGLQYLAADKEARPIYLNRTICEADIVVPITMSRLTESLDYVGGYSGLFPTFADLETQQRFRSPSSADHSVHQRRREQEANEAAWLLGIHFVVQIVPGAGDHVLHVVAGEARAAVDQAHDLHQAAWLHSLPQRASLVVAAIDGDDDQQTWENFARALYAAMQAAADGGAIALLTDLARKPGPALARLAAGERGAALMHSLSRDRSPDAMAAALLAEAQERFDVFLVSSLENDLIEDLGMGSVDDPSQLERLVRQHKSLVLLGSAQFAGVETSVLV